MQSVLLLNMDRCAVVQACFQAEEIEQLRCVVMKQFPVGEFAQCLAKQIVPSRPPPYFPPWTSAANIDLHLEYTTFYHENELKYHVV